MHHTDDTRASIARRRLDALTAAYDAQIPRTSEPLRRALQGSAGPRSHAAEPRWRISTPHLRVAATVAVAAAILMTWWLMSGRPRTSEPAPVQLAARHGSDAAPKASEVIVDVTGKVRRPGIVTLKAGARVHQAIAKAGGPIAGADTTGINLARVLADGEQIVVGAPGAPGALGGAPAPSGAGPGRISLSSATPDQLDSLPGIGPVTAQAIIDFRMERGGFRGVEDLLEVSGIGERTLADIRDQVTP